MSNYLALYVESLEKRIEEGGTQEEVDKAFAEYNTFNQEAFDKWLAELPAVSCASCGVNFKPEPGAAAAEILCKEHALK
jgi:hypothetical protein